MPIKLPESMKLELDRWNSGKGIPVDQWIGCVGNVDLAVGYASIFWPTFEVVGDYLLREGWTKESIEGFERQPHSTPASVEWVINHRHILDIHANTEVEATPQHLLLLGSVLKDIYTAKLMWEFPSRPCEVEFYVPDDPDDLLEYQVSFWQKKWDDE